MGGFDLIAWAGSGVGSFSRMLFDAQLWIAYIRVRMGAHARVHAIGAYSLRMGSVHSYSHVQ